MAKRIQRFAALLAAALAITVGKVAASKWARADRVQESPQQSRNQEALQITNATGVMQEVLSANEQTIPRAVLEKAVAIAVLPYSPPRPGVRGQGPTTRKSAFMHGIRARGILSARNESRHWSAPVFVTVNGGSPAAGDLILVFMSRAALDRVLGNQFKVDAKVVAGPLAADAKDMTDTQSAAEILTYSRTRGVVAGVTLDANMLMYDGNATALFYGKTMRGAQVLAQTSAPDPAAAWRAALEKNVR